jgi:hypothetical protein
MWKIIDAMPYGVLIVAAVLLLLAPVKPMPHVVEKLIMLKNGQLKRGLDIFDLVFHLLPTILLLIKFGRDYWRTKGG